VENPEALETFLAGQQDMASFRHADHVRVAFEMLKRHSFLASADLYSRQLKQMTASIGKPTAYNETVTIAFLAMIAERLAKRHYESFAAFAEENPEVLEKSALTNWYSPEQLHSDIARRTFILPGRVRPQPSKS
jgi:hypothetical protein